MADSKEQLKHLKYGSLEKIKEALRIGAGVLYRQDVEILMNYINELEGKAEKNKAQK